MDSTGPLKVCCGIWHQDVCNRSFKSFFSPVPVKDWPFYASATLGEMQASGMLASLGKLKPMIKSKPIPMGNKGPVKVAVGRNFEEVVMDTKKDVLLEFYAPRCGHCKTLDPEYVSLAKTYKHEKNLVIAKMGATANNVPYESYKVEGFCTIYFAPSSNKQNPVKFEGGESVEVLSAFLEKHATKLSQERDEL